MVKEYVKKVVLTLEIITKVSEKDLDIIVDDAERYFRMFAKHVKKDGGMHLAIPSVSVSEMEVRDI